MVHDVTLLRDIALGIIFAAVLGHAARLLRQPLLLGYIAGGILLSSQMGFGLVTDPQSIELISEIGLILLLFIIGLEIDLRELERLGRSMLALGVGQFVVNALLGVAFFSWLGYRVGERPLRPRLPRDRDLAQLDPDRGQAAAREVRAQDPLRAPHPGGAGGDRKSVV